VDFAEHLRTARTRCGLSQRDLAARSGVAQPTIAAIESRRRTPSAATRTALDDALKVRPSQALARYRDAVLATIDLHHGTEAVVFGSVARGEDEPDSDLDLMITFPEETDIVDVLNLTDELEVLLGVTVDVISGRVDSPVAAQARHDAVPL
jgi:predicted nucleotidyltransferase